jgi:cellulose synthase/poly-beta-1,6-N-acetylglucosamine synthase-like glycosyltransferase
MKNLLFNAGKRYAGLSVSLMGTGMVFTREVIERYGWTASSVAEDLEQSINLIEHGETVRFVADARVKAQESSNLRTGYTQRQRWATGRRDLRRRAWGLVRSGLRSRSLARTDLGCELLLPSYSGLLNATVLLLPITGFLSTRWIAPLIANLALLAYQIFEVGIAYSLMGPRARDLLALAYAPVFLVWKGVIEVLARFGVQRTAWIRTERSRHPDR